jgi:RNA polymerase sigma factor (sigma-70 family)
LIQNQSFEDIARQFEPMIKSTIKKLHVYKNFEEMYQIGFIALWEAYWKYDPQKGYFAGYAQTTVRGRMLTALTESKKYDERHTFPDPGSEQYDYFSFIIDESCILPFEDEGLTDYFKGLSRREMTWVNKGLWQGMKTKEIAADEHVSPHTVRSWKKQAIKKMRNNAERLLKV